MHTRNTHRKTPVTLLAASIGLALYMPSAFAQEAAAPVQDPAPQASAEAATDLDTIVVTGYRASLERSLDIKRGETGMVDAIVAQDIGKFPDLNLAESLQRIPGVVITRDGGEGRQITVRGLGPAFTRVRLNGLEAMSSVGSSDGQGGANRSRAFDFNVFASDLFSQLVVRKTAQASVDEGSLGATVDLRTARPFDYDGFQAATNVQASWNDAAGAASPRFAGIISDTWADGTFGALLSVAYSERNTVDEGSGTVRWAGGTTNGGFNPASPFKPALLATTFAPRFPRYTFMEHEQDRLGVTGSLQWRPSDSTQFNFDGLYSKIDAIRNERYIEANGLSASGTTGKRQIIVQDGVVENNALVYARMDDVDIRAENRHDEWATEFYQFSLDGEHEFNDSFRLYGKVGTSKSEHKNPIQTTIMMDKLNVDGYSYDYRGNMNKPVFNYGVSPTDPNGWTLSTIRMRENYVTNEFDTADLNFSWLFNSSFTLEGGIQAKDYSFDSIERRRAATETIVPTFPDGTRIVPVDMVDLASLKGLNGNPGAWVVPDFNQIAELFDIFSDTGTFAMANYVPSDYSVQEEDRGVWLMGKFGFDLGSVPVTGDAGVRYVKTKQSSTGVATASGVPVQTTVDREYSDTLPSLNLVAELNPDLLLRFGAAKVMSRPGLNALTPGVSVSVSGSAMTISGGNPMLDPTRANTLDLGLEWYFQEGAMLGAAVFYKDIDNFVQNFRESVVYADTGLPASLLDGTTATVNDTFVLTGPLNTPGGELQGVELNYVQPFTFLSGVWQNFGAQLNYTYVDSEMQYLLSNGTAAQKAPLVGQSKNSWNATLFYEGDRFSGRISATNRNDYLIQVPGTEVGFNSDAAGYHGQSGTTILDASIRYKLSENAEVSVEGQNLTNEAQESWVANPSVSLPLEYGETGRTFLLGLRYKF